MRVALRDLKIPGCKSSALLRLDTAADHRCPPAADFFLRVAAGFPTDLDEDLRLAIALTHPRSAQG